MVLGALLGLVLGGRMAPAADWFGPVVSTTLPFTVLYGAAGDVNGDSRLDMVLIDTSSDVRVYASETSGGFVPLADRTGTYSAPNVADTNGNGLPEVICAGSGRKLYIFEAQLDGQLAVTPITVPLPGYGGIVSARASTVDLDSDGCDDLALPADRGVMVFWGAPSGPPGPAEFYPLPLDPGCLNVSFATAVASGDVTSDGMADMVVAARWGIVEECPPFKAGLCVLRRTGPRSFAYDGQWIGYIESSINSDTRYLDLALADLDGDNSLDIATLRSWDSGPPRMYRGFGNGNFAGVVPSIVDEYAKYFVLAADLDHNGTVDLVTSSGARLTVHNGLGGFQYTQIQEYVGTNAGARWVGLGTTDGDSRADLVGVSTSGAINVFPGLLTPSSSADEASPRFSQKISVVPNVLSREQQKCVLTGPGTQATSFDLFDALGRRVTSVRATPDGFGGLRGEWTVGGGAERPAPGVYFVRLGDGPTGKLTLIE